MTMETTPTRTARKSIVASTVTAFVKGMRAAQPLQVQPNALALQSPLTSPSTQPHLEVLPIAQPLRLEGNASANLLA